jgi:hypothetical protein
VRSPAQSDGAQQAAERRLYDRRVRRILLTLLVLVAAYFLPRGEYPNPDSHLALTYALVEQHTVRIDHYLTMSGSLAPLLDKAVYCGPHTDTRTCTRYYSDKAPVVSFWTALIYAPLRLLLPSWLMPTQPGSDRFILRWLLTILAVSVPCGLFLGLFWQFLADLVGRESAFLVTMGYGFGSIALIFSTLLFSHALTAVLVGTAFFLLYRGTRTPDAVRGVAARRLGVAGIMAGLAVGCEYPAATITCLLGLYVVTGTRAGWLRRGLVYAAGVGIGLVPLLVYNVLVFGSPFSLGYLHLPDPYYAHGMQEGLFGVGLPQPDAVWGITFGAERGLFYFCPWLLLAFPGFRGMQRAGYGREALLCGAITLSYFLLVSGYVFWNGGASVGPRHFLPALPFLALPVAFALRPGGIYRLAWGLVGVSCLCMVAVLATGPLLGFGDPLWHETVPALLEGKVQNNWGMLVQLQGLPSLLPLVVGVAWLLRGLVLPGHHRFLHFFYRPATLR